jgi:hypothetical protein
MPLTRREHEKTIVQRVVRAWEIEDALVARIWDDVEAGIPELAAVAAEAMERLDFTLEMLPEGVEVWGWPIVTEERALFKRVQGKYPADSDVRQRASTLVDEFLQEATLDEVARGAFTALHWADLAKWAYKKVRTPR